MIADEQPLTNDERRELWARRVAEATRDGGPELDMYEDGSERMLCSLMLVAVGFIIGIVAAKLWALL